MLQTFKMHLIFSVCSVNKISLGIISSELRTTPLLASAHALMTHFETYSDFSDQFFDILKLSKVCLLDKRSRLMTSFSFLMKLS